MGEPIIVSKVGKGGNSWVFRVPKALIDSRVIKRDTYYVLTVREIEAGNGPKLKELDTTPPGFDNTKRAYALA